MADELEKTIEELEAEVLADLEEASEKPLGKGKDVDLLHSDGASTTSKSKDHAPNTSPNLTFIPTPPLFLDHILRYFSCAKKPV